jgi:hypothetical protein
VINYDHLDIVAAKKVVKASTPTTDCNHVPKLGLCTC